MIGRFYSVAPKDLNRFYLRLLLLHTPNATGYVGAGALIGAVIGGIGGAAALGVSAIAFQFIAMYAMALLVVLLISAALSSVGLDEVI